MILPNTNELLRAAESALSNEERLSSYKERKARYDAQNRLQRAYDDYLDKRCPQDAGEPEWWSYIDADQEFQEKHDAS